MTPLPVIVDNDRFSTRNFSFSSVLLRRFLCTHARRTDSARFLITIVISARNQRVTKGRQTFFSCTRDGQGPRKISTIPFVSFARENIYARELMTSFNGSRFYDFFLAIEYIHVTLTRNDRLRYL